MASRTAIRSVNDDRQEIACDRVGDGHCGSKLGLLPVTEVILACHSLQNRGMEIPVENRRRGWPGASVGHGPCLGTTGVPRDSTAHNCDKGDTQTQSEDRRTAESDCDTCTPLAHNVHFCSSAN